MFAISKKSDYGLELLLILAQKGLGTIVSLKTIAKENKLPYRFISQLAVELKRAGILGSREGFGGGYFLNKQPKEITMTQIISALDDKKRLVKCSTNSQCHRIDFCQCKTAWHKLQADINKVLASYNLADMMRENA